MAVGTGTREATGGSDELDGPDVGKGCDAIDAAAGGGPG